MRWLLCAVCVVSSFALAAPTKPKANPLGNAKEDEDAVGGLALPVSESAARDAALLRGVLWAFEPAPTEIRVQAAEDLGLLGDPRALNPLAQLLSDGNPAVQLAAMRAITSIKAPRAEEILANVVRHPTLPERLKLAAVEGIVFQNTDSAISFLKRVTVATSLPAPIVASAKRILTEVPASRGGAQ